jgi:putative transposase
MPFGLTNPPSVYMAAMNDILADLGFVAVYLDDIMIFSKTPEEHVKHVREVFEKVESSGFFLKLKKM